MSCLLTKSAEINEKYDLLSFFEVEPAQEKLDEFTEMWYNDLMNVYDKKDKLVEAAQAILIYFGIKKSIVDVDYDQTDDALIWSVTHV